MPREAARRHLHPVPRRVQGAAGNGESRLVAATYTMSTEIFAKHFTARHFDSLAGMTKLPGNLAYDVEISYRKFHERLHATRVDYTHHHSPDPEEAAIEWSLYCIQRNRGRGWHEIAGCDGGLVSVFPAGEIATKINGRIQHHADIPEAVKRLASGA
jgi:hypothetical protein